MKIVRAIDSNGDWVFGLGQASYLSGAARINQNIQTRLFEKVGDCFFNLGAGLDPGLYAQKNLLALDLAIRGIILGTDGVLGISSISSKLSSSRAATFTYNVVTLYGTISNMFTYTTPAGSP